MTKLKVVDLLQGRRPFSRVLRKSDTMYVLMEIDARCCETIEANASSTEQIFNVDITDHKSYLKDLKASIGDILTG